MQAFNPLCTLRNSNSDRHAGHFALKEDGQFIGNFMFQFLNKNVPSQIASN